MGDLRQPAVRSLSIFFPCFNDAATIGTMVERATAALDRWGVPGEVIVVNDGSQDDSADVLEALTANNDRLRVVTHATNGGYGAALQSGFAAASNEWVFYTDGDGQYDPAELDLLIQRAGDEVDVVQGFKLQRSDSVVRRLVGRLYHRTVRALFGLRVRDTDCDFRLIRRACVTRFDLQNTNGAICVELVRRLQMAGARFVEVGVHHYPRAYGSSTFFKPGNVVRTFLGLGKLWAELVVFAQLRPTAMAPTPQREGSGRRWLVAGLGVLGVFALTLFTSLHVPVSRSDEAWFLWVAHRANTGSVLYRDVYYVTTPLALWCMQLAVKIFGTTLTVERALSAACFTASLVMVWMIAKRVGMGRLGRVLLALALFLYASRLAHFGSVYSMLAVSLALGALLGTLRWVDAVASEPALPHFRLLAGTGVLTGLAFATKPNTGLLALVAVGVTVLVGARRSTAAGSWRTLGPVATGFGGVVAAMMVPILVQGSWSDFVSDVVTGKTDYPRLLGDNAFNSVTSAVQVLGSASAPISQRLLVTAPLVIVGALVAMVIAALARGPRGWSPTFVALVGFSLVGLGATVPDFGPQHLTEAAPLLLGVTVLAIFAVRPILAPAHVPSLRVVAASTAVILVLATGTVVLNGKRPATSHHDHVVAASFAAFSGTMISASNERFIHSDVVRLRHYTRGNVFIVAPEAPFYYLVGQLRNPTPFDFPARTDFGAAGEQGVIRRLQHAHVHWVCLRPASARRSSTSPVACGPIPRARLMATRAIS